MAQPGNTSGKGKGRAVDGVHAHHELDGLSQLVERRERLGRELDNMRAATAPGSGSEDSEDEQTSHAFLSSTSRYSSLPLHQQPPRLSPSIPSSSRAPSPYRTHSQLATPALSRQSSSDAIAQGSEVICARPMRDVERSMGTGGPIAPLPDRKHSARNAPRVESTSHTHTSRAPTPISHSPPPAPTHHLLAGFRSLNTSPAPGQSVSSSSMSRSDHASDGRNLSSTTVSSPRPRASSSTDSMTAARLQSFADPHHPWVAQDDLTTKSFDRAMASDGRAGGGHDGRGADGKVAVADDRTGSPGGAKSHEGLATFHSVHHRPSSTFPSTTSSPPLPLPAAAADSTPRDPSLADILAQISSTIACPACHKALRDPTTLGCGHSVCHTCSLPAPIAFIRPHLDFSNRVLPSESQFARNPSVPIAPSLGRAGSLQGGSMPVGHSDRAFFSRPQALGPGGVRGRMACPVKDCTHKERSATTLSETKVDYVLQKVMSLLRRDVVDFDLEVNSVEMDTEMADDEVRLTRGGSCSSGESGGGVEETLNEADLKRLHHSRDFKTSKRQRGFVSSLKFDVEGVPTTFLSELQSELECQVCVQLFHEPMTTPCGHTFCAKCLARTLDHSDKCPLCRADIPSFNFFQSQPINAATQSIIAAAFPVLAAERKTSLEDEARSSSMDTPIFVCTLAWPNLPTYIHIFEPRYRLMMRRVMDGDRMFGMVLPSRNDGGVSEYGTMLQVQSCNMIEDGRSIVETIGSYRFRVLEKGTFDGYTVGRIERVDDISAEQEAEYERLALARNLPASSSVSLAPAPGSAAPPLELSTAQLMTICLEFVQTLRSGSAPWVLQRLNNTIGPMPTNPSDFSFWMGEVMPVDDHVKAALLQYVSSSLFDGANELQNYFSPRATATARVLDRAVPLELVVQQGMLTHVSWPSAGWTVDDVRSDFSLMLVFCPRSPALCFYTATRDSPCFPCPTPRIRAIGFSLDSTRRLLPPSFTMPIELPSIFVAISRSPILAVGYGAPPRRARPRRASFAARAPAERVTAARAPLMDRTGFHSCSDRARDSSPNPGW